MDKLQAKLEAVKMVKDWSAWLVAIQATICAFLWNVVKNNTPENWLDRSITYGWFAFALSIIVATLIVSNLPTMIEKLTEKPNEGSIFDEPVSIVGVKVKLRTLLTIEHFFFLTGIVLIVVHFVRLKPNT